MASFNRHCDILQGYNFKKDVQTSIGYITSLTIGDTKFTSKNMKQTCKDPMSPETDLAAIVVLSAISWDIGPTDTIYLAGQVSPASQQSIRMLTYKDLSKVNVSIQFAIYDYDPIEKKYYKSMLPTDDAALDAILEKQGADLSLQVADDASSEVQSPPNYSFSIGIKPQTEKEQNITIAASFSDKVVKAWGLKLA